ncbi:lipase 3-like isoform X1 [Pogonomyrmex barbatus]|uniref:Lipase 3-like isoform X1 n=1 Tax=Pogonomyrmex barbatus TaxID=144034 RepID=A0A6I9W868_9HYME|nr:lipase 3-like isoform X1 [Pogonomyrmex barbatus]
MAVSDMKSILFAFVIIMFAFSERKSQFLQDKSFLEENILNFFFPKDPGLIKVRKINKIEGVTDIRILDFIGLVEQYGYPAEEHNVTTEDGYNLKIHRISGSLSDNERKKEIVFMQHGFLASSHCWILQGPDKDLAFLLADQGYDIWIGNMRGNTYCRSHVNMTTYERKFWQYSFHEVGTRDLPAMFNYIFNYTKQKDLYYIGHSMGTTSLFTLLSMKPEYNTKIKMAICLAPVVVNIKETSTFNVFNLSPVIKEVLEKREIYDLFPQSLATVTIARTLCNYNAMTQFICITILFLLFGSDPAQLNTILLPKIFAHFPAGGSLHTFDHYYQNFHAGDFRSYDYGITENYERYKQKIPPSYDVEKITAPIILFYAANDVLATEKNTLELSKRLPNVLLIEKVPYKFFNHIDFLWAIDAKTLLYDHILELIRKFNAKQNIRNKSTQ